MIAKCSLSNAICFCASFAMSGLTLVVCPTRAKLGAWADVDDEMSDRIGDVDDELSARKQTHTNINHHASTYQKDKNTQWQCDSREEVRLTITSIFAANSERRKCQDSSFGTHPICQDSSSGTHPYPTMHLKDRMLLALLLDFLLPGLHRH